MAESRDGLDLHTHQVSSGACAFYERLDFVAVEYGVSPPRESARDVRYRWQPPPPRPVTSAANAIGEPL